jgi:Fur family transcriptional regulator, peroxide stress response regulator
MRRTAEEMSSMLDRFRAILRNSGAKLTPQRLEIYRETARTCDHPDIAAIFRNVRKAMPTVSLDTVYRALDLFKRLGLVNALRPDDTQMRFDADVRPHHHFICVRCGLTRDVFDRSLDRLEIPESAKGLGRMDSAHVALKGLCLNCQKGREKTAMNGDSPVE